jgi:hypothetical protein
VEASLTFFNLLERLAEREPLVVVFDDFQYAISEKVWSLKKLLGIATEK